MSLRFEGRSLEAGATRGKEQSRQKVASWLSCEYGVGSSDTSRVVRPVIRIRHIPSLLCLALSLLMPLHEAAMRRRDLRRPRDVCALCNKEGLFFSCPPPCPFFHGFMRLLQSTTKTPFLHPFSCAEMGGGSGSLAVILCRIFSHQDRRPAYCRSCMKLHHAERACQGREWLAGKRQTAKEHNE